MESVLFGAAALKAPPETKVPSVRGSRGAASNRSRAASDAGSLGALVERLDDDDDDADDLFEGFGNNEPLIEPVNGGNEATWSATAGARTLHLPHPVPSSIGVSSSGNNWSGMPTPHSAPAAFGPQADHVDDLLDAFEDADAFANDADAALPPSGQAFDDELALARWRIPNSTDCPLGLLLNCQSPLEHRWLLRSASMKLATLF